MMNGSASPFIRRAASASLLAAVLAWPSLPRAQAILANEVVDPRTFGYVVGDKIRREVRLSLDTDFRLDADGLPEGGRLDRWLEMAEPKVRVEPIDDGHRYTVSLTYQVFGAPAALETVTIPQLNLRVIGEKQVLTTLVPALRVTVAPITPTADTDRLRASALQQDRSPAPLPLEGQLLRLGVMLAALLALLLYGAWRRGLMVFGRGDRPFTRALRELKRLQRTADAPPPFADGLRIVHEAVNRTAGRAVFAHNLDDFLKAHPHFAGLREDFDRLFAASERMFFGKPAATVAGDWPALLRLCRRCSKLERREPVRPLPEPEQAGAA